MPTERTPKTREDIRDAASFVLAVTEDKKLEDYAANRLLRQAIERNFEVIGEAVGRLARDDPDTVSRLSGTGGDVTARRRNLRRGCRAERWRFLLR